MNDDLNLLITFYSTSCNMEKAAIHVEHGMNNPNFENFVYFNEPVVADTLISLLPPHVQELCLKILAVEEIFYIGKN